MGHGVVTSAHLQSLVAIVLVLVLFHQTQAQIVDWGETETLPYEDMGAKDHHMKVTKLHFYLHDIVTGNDPSIVLVAQPPRINPSPANFGLLAMLDNPLTQGPELTSKLVGRAQGLVGLAGRKERIAIMAISHVFTDGKYNESTLSIHSRNPIVEGVRELAVVGGTGIFRFARGYAISRTYAFNSTTLDGVYEYNVYVIHYN